MRVAHYGFSRYRLFVLAVVRRPSYILPFISNLPPHSFHSAFHSAFHSLDSFTDISWPLFTPQFSFLQTFTHSFDIPFSNPTMSGEPGRTQHPQITTEQLAAEFTSKRTRCEQCHRLTEANERMRYVKNVRNPDAGRYVCDKCIENLKSRMASSSPSSIYTPSQGQQQGQQQGPPMPPPQHRPYDMPPPPPPSSYSSIQVGQDYPSTYGRRPVVPAPTPGSFQNPLVRQYIAAAQRGCQ